MSLFAGGVALAEERRPAMETRFGVADVERILHSYWRTPRVRAEAERYRTSEEFQQKQRELATLDRELARQRFRFFRRQQTTREIQEKRNELQRLADKEAQRAHEREEEAVDELMDDIRRAASSIGREQELTVIFDSNTPNILFLSTYATGISDVTDVVVDKLNTR